MIRFCFGVWLILRYPVTASLEARGHLVHKIRALEFRGNDDGLACLSPASAIHFSST